MGVKLVYDPQSSMWELIGCNFKWIYPTREKAEADRQKAFVHHLRKLEARRCLINMLLEHR